jgi:hypothetical protein
MCLVSILSYMKPEKTGINTNIQLALETVPGEMHAVTLQEAIARDLPIGALFTIGENPKNILQVLKQAGATARTSFSGSQISEIRAIAETDSSKGISSTTVNDQTGIEFISKFLESQKEKDEITLLLRLVDETENPNLSTENINGYTEAIRLKNALDAITDKQLMELYLPILKPSERLKRLGQIPDIKAATSKFLSDYLALTTKQD